MTSLRGGVRVPKDDIRIEANGTIDLLNALIGKLRVMPDIEEDWKSYLQEIQNELMTEMSHVATPQDKTNPRTLHVVELTAKMEQKMDEVIDGKDRGALALYRTHWLVGFGRDSHRQNDSATSRTPIVDGEQGLSH